MQRERELQRRWHYGRRWTRNGSYPSWWHPWQIRTFLQSQIEPPITADKVLHFWTMYASYSYYSSSLSWTLLRVWEVIEIAYAFFCLSAMYCKTNAGHLNIYTQPVSIFNNIYNPKSCFTMLLNLHVPGSGKIRRWEKKLARFNCWLIIQEARLMRVYYVN